jgi:RHS repeat-associated protein
VSLSVLRFVRLLAVLVCGVGAVCVVGVAAASADSWSIEGGTHYLKGSGGEVLRSWMAKEWRLWSVELQAVGECMGVAEGCAAKEVAGETPVEDVPGVTAEDAEKGIASQRVIEEGANGPFDEALDLAGVDAGTLPSDLGSGAIASAKFIHTTVGVELGNGMVQLYKVPEKRPFTSTKEEEEVEAWHGELREVAGDPKEHVTKIEYCDYNSSGECEDKRILKEYPVGTFFLSLQGWGGYLFGYTEEEEGKIRHQLEGWDVPTGWERFEAVTAESDYGGHRAATHEVFVTHSSPVCGSPPSGYSCSLAGIPTPGLFNSKLEEHNEWTGLPVRPKESSPVTLPSDPPSSLGEGDEEAISENTVGREEIEKMFPEKTREEAELEEKEEALLGGPSEAEFDRLFCEKGKAVNCATGDEFQSQSDLSVGGRGPALGVALTYNSQLARKESAHGPFGYGWTGAYGAHIEFKHEGRIAVVHQENGSTVTFVLLVSGYWGGLGPAVTAGLVHEGSGNVFILPDGLAMHFNSSGWLTSEADRSGNTLTMTRNAEGRLEAVKDAAGREITLKYNGAGEVESATDPMGHTVKYTYEGGNLATVTLPGESSANWKYKYDESHELTSETDGRGNTTTREYFEGKVISETEPMSRARKWSYEPWWGDGRYTTITEPNGAKTHEHFNEAGEPLSVQNDFDTPLESETFYGYNSQQQLISSTNADGKNTEYTYDSYGDRVWEKNPDGDETSWEYTWPYELVGITSPTGEKTTIKRNSDGDAEVVERPAPGGTTQKTTFKYDADGDVESMTNPLERTWKYEYDGYGDRKAETDPESNKRTWEYNEDSQEIAEVSPRGNASGAKASEFTTKTERDQQGRPLKITDPLGHTTKYTYDADGDVETLTDGNSHKTRYTYDADDELTKTEAPNKIVTETEYDSMGQPISETDGNKHVTKYVRNLLEEIEEIVNPLGKKTLEEYDAAGNLIKLTDPAKRSTSYTYDPAGRLTEVSYSSGKPATIKYEYNKDGDRTKMTDGTGTTTNTYDQLDRMTESENGHKEISKYEYNLGNQQTKITYPNGKAVERAYDKDGRLEKITDWSSNITKFAYNPDSELATIAFPTASKDEDSYAYNDADQMTEAKMDKSTEVLASLVYTRDSDGQVKKTTAKKLPGSEVTENTYDENNRLTKYGSTEYKYDAGNNPTTEGSSTNSFNEGDQLEKGTGVKYSYDELGERTKTTPEKGPATTYGYDQASNLTSVERPKEGETTEIKDTYTYNGENLRTSQTIAGTTSYLAWDTTEELPMILTDGTNSYIYGPDALPIEQISSGGTVTSLHHDQAGSTRLLTGSTGTVTGKCTYGAYGSSTCEGTTTTPLGFDAQYTSSDTGLIYLRNRVYDPATAQFLTIDPLDEGSSTLAHATGEQYVAAALRSASGSGPYVYANDNPLKNYDPTGLFTVGICVHGEVNFILHIGASGCVQGSSSGEVGGTVVGSVGVAQGAGVGATVGPQVSNAEHISELSGPFANAGGQLGVGPDVSLEAFGAPGQCGPIVGGGVSAGAGLGVSRWIGGSYTGAWSVSF